MELVFFYGEKVLGGGGGGGDDDGSRINYEH